MSYLKFKKFAVIGIGTAFVGGIYYVDNNNLLLKLCNETIKNKEQSSISNWNKFDYNWDKKIKNLSPPDDSEKPKVKTIHHLILVRHGQYNVKGETDEECYLTELGRKQAEATGLRLSKFSLPNSSIVKSTMKRAQETSQLIESFLPSLPVTSDSLLEEGCPIDPEPNPYLPSMWQCDTVESRIEVAFRKYFHRPSTSEKEDTHTILVCHGNVIRYFICRALQIPPERWLTMNVSHGSITWISIHNNGMVQMRTSGDSGHMPPEMITR